MGKITVREWRDIGEIFDPPPKKNKTVRDKILENFYDKCNNEGLSGGAIEK